jgi:ABC-type dipeptide/oligopeptide/nickel transport system permease component
MAKFLVRRFMTLLFTMVVVSMVIFAIAEVAPGDVVRHLLGQFATPEQEQSLREQLGLTRPLWQRYVTWLIGSDTFWARPKVGMPLQQTISRRTGFAEWWAEEPDGTLIRWKLEGNDLVAMRRQADGTVQESLDNGRWNIDAADEAARLAAYQEDLLMSTQLAVADRQAISLEITRLVEILRREDQTTTELLAAIEGAEDALDAFRDEEALAHQNGLAIAASGMLQNDVLKALEDARILTDADGSPDEEYLKTVPNRLGKAATALTKFAPELAEQLREATKYVLARDMKAVRASLDEVVGPMSDLTQPLTELARVLGEEDYVGAAAFLEGMFDPTSPSDPAVMGLMAGQFTATARALRDTIPEIAAEFTQASEGLEGGDVAATDAALGEVAGFLREQGPLMARNDAVKKAKVARYFWGVDNANHAVKWETGGEHIFWLRAKSAGWWTQQEGGASEYIPLQKGFLRGDPGESVRTRQPVSAELIRRVRNSLVLAGIAFVVVMPLALLMGLVAGLNEGQPIDRVFSLFGLVTTASPSFATGVFLILVFAVWLDLFPGVTVFTSSSAIFESPQMLVLPVLTLTLLELGYVLRITRASMVEVMKAAYIRTAFLKGLPYWRIVFRHAVRNALMAPITVIMLHVNWLMGGIVIVEALFGFPGLGTFLLSSALYKDVFAIEAGAMFMVTLAVGTQLVADIIYTFLNPRIRYA